MTSRHHRRPRSRGGDSSRRNIVRVPADKHAAWHLLFVNLSPHEIAAQINAVWLDPDFYFTVQEVPR